MPDKVKILLNGTDAFAPQPTPYIGLEESNVYFGEYWAKEETMTLVGQITGCTFGNIFSGQQAIIEKFKKSYQPLEIWQEQNGVSGRIFLKNLTEVTSISFDSDKWVGVLPYSISLKCYPSGYFSGAFGILDPVDTWAFTEQQNYSSEITHTISCKGYNTSSGFNNALENARIWTFNKRTLGSVMSPAFISNFSTGNVCLISTNETIDRIAGTYSITDTYTSDLTRTGYGIFRYTTDFNSGDNKITANLNGQIQGCGQDMAKIRSAFGQLDKAATVAVSYQKIFGRTDLNVNPLSYTITEDPYETSIQFSYSYDNDNSPDPYFDYTVNLVSGDAISASINGSIVARGDVRNKLIKAKAYAKTVDLYALTVPYYQFFYPNANLYPLNPRPVSSGIAINESQGTVQLNAEFSNSDQIDSTLDSFEYTLSFLPSLPKLDSQARLNGSGVFSIVDLGYVNRASISINGTSQININATVSAGLYAIKSKVMSLFAQYGGTQKVVLDVNQLNSERADKRKVSFTFTWSFDSPNIVTSNYSGIDILSV